MPPITPKTGTFPFHNPVSMTYILFSFGASDSEWGGKIFSLYYTRVNEGRLGVATTRVPLPQLKSLQSQPRYFHTIFLMFKGCQVS